MRQLIHQIKEGDRWDTVAYLYYGSAFAMNHLIEANPHLDITETLPMGRIMFIPILTQLPHSETDLPPWKR